ncbi:Wzt carbohydrate-binding domain-containing protein [Polynucleobacter sp.]|uniref:Wzt carbohydrate-binding domain-containing protein n=1 Tax=Polynucleobacter sp. TaxID=2029855 RepID=UPI003F69798D
MSKSVTILGVDVLDSNDIQVSKVKIADQLTIRTYMRANIDGEYTSAIELKNRYGQVVTSNGSYTLGLPPLRLRSGEVGIFEIKITCMLEAGQYSFQSTVEMDAHEISLGVPVAISPWLGPISVDWEYGIDRAPFLGMFGVPVSAKFLKLIDIKSPKSGSEI